MLSLLYHNVKSLDLLELLLDKGFILKYNRIKIPCVYMTRDFKYLSYRGIRMVFNRDILCHKEMKKFKY